MSRTLYLYRCTSFCETQLEYCIHFCTAVNFAVYRHPNGRIPLYSILRVYQICGSQHRYTPIAGFIQKHGAYAYTYKAKYVFEYPPLYFDGMGIHKDSESGLKIADFPTFSSMAVTHCVYSVGNGFSTDTLEVWLLEFIPYLSPWEVTSWPEWPSGKTQFANYHFWIQIRLPSLSHEFSIIWRSSTKWHHTSRCDDHWWPHRRSEDQIWDHTQCTW